MAKRLIGKDKRTIYWTTFINTVYAIAQVGSLLDKRFLDVFR